MKQTLLTLISILSITALSAQAFVPMNGTQSSHTTLAGSSQAWTSTGNTFSSDDTYASFGDLPNTVGAYTDYLTVTGFNINIPTGVTISGIKVDIERSDANQVTSDYSIRLIKNAMIGAVNRSTGLAYPAADSYQSYGSTSDLWGDTWSRKDVGGASFGVAIAAQRRASGAATSGRIDHVRITVYTTSLIILPVKLTSFSASKTGRTVQVKWTTVEESSIDHYEIERSSNGRDFTTIGSVVSGNSSSTTNYGYSDNTPVKGTSWYRLKIVEQTGPAKNSSIVQIHLDETGANTLYPTLLQAGQTVSITNPRNEALKVQFFATGGQLVSSVTTTTGQVPGTAIANAKGMLYYKVADSKGSITGTGKIIID